MREYLAWYPWVTSCAHTHRYVTDMHFGWETGCRLSDITRCNSPVRRNLRNARNYFVNEVALPLLRVSYSHAYTLASRFLHEIDKILDLGLTDSYNYRIQWDCCAIESWIMLLKTKFGNIHDYEDRTLNPDDEWPHLASFHCLRLFLASHRQPISAKDFARLLSRKLSRNILRDISFAGAFVNLRNHSKTSDISCSFLLNNFPSMWYHITTAHFISNFHFPES